VEVEAGEKDEEVLVVVVTVVAVLLVEVVSSVVVSVEVVVVSSGGAGWSAGVAAEGWSAAEVIAAEAVAVGMENDQHHHNQNMTIEHTQRSTLHQYRGLLHGTMDMVIHILKNAVLHKHR